MAIIRSMLATVFFFLLTLSGYQCHQQRLELQFNADYSGYTVFMEEFVAAGPAISTPLFIGAPFAVFCDGMWHTVGIQQQDPLVLASAEQMEGADTTLGTFSGIRLTWRTTASNTRFVTTAKVYPQAVETGGSAIVFSVHFPDGANQTSTIRYANSTRDQVIVNWPALYCSSFLPNALSWEGSFMQPILNGFSKGPTGGPTVFYNASDNSLQTVIIGSVWDGAWKSYSSGTGYVWNGSKTAWAPGLSGTLESIPAGFNHSTILYLGGRGITNTMAAWGQVLRASRKSANKIRDVTVSKLGYQTDNGAMYCFCQDQNCSNTLIKEVESLQMQGITLGYLSFQGAGSSGGRGNAAPWCVATWGVDGGLGPNYPMALADLQRAIGIPLQLYAPYFCPESIYFNDTEWKPVLSNSSLPACDGFDFQNVSPSQSRHFYDWFLKKGAKVNMISFETDFMNQNYNCVSEFVESTTNSPLWLWGMADAALALNVSIQWCYSTPSDVFVSVDLPAVTNFRVSFDYCYGRSWDIGVSSLLVWTLGARPSKDTFWTTPNNYTVTPGCPWTPDHEPPACELHIMLALLSTGPVGVSDGIGGTNVTLLWPTISRDGTLLQPSKAVTSIDATFLAKGAPQGQVLATYGAGRSWYVLGFQVSAEYRVRIADLYPKPDLSDSGGVIVYRRFLYDRNGCVNATDAVKSGCISPVVNISSSSTLTDVLFTIPASDFSNVTAGTAYKPTLTTVWQGCEHSGWILLGELSKYVALSPVRFINVECTNTGVRADVRGWRDESVVVSAVCMEGLVYLEYVLEFEADGIQHLELGDESMASAS